MRKFLSLVLAIVMVASVAVVSISAADSGVATVTLKGIDGKTVTTQTYAVGETFTATTYLNVSEICNACSTGLASPCGLGSINGTQYYTNSILTLADEYDPDEGDIIDTDAMFPVLKSNVVANGIWVESKEDSAKGAIYFNASTPNHGSGKGFKFASDESIMIVSHYTVKAAGEAVIENPFTTLAVADYYLTRIIDQGEIKKSNFSSPVALSEPTIPIPSDGFTVSGKATSYLTNEGVDDVTLKLTGSDNDFTAEVTVTADSYKGVKADTDYSFENVPAGTYTLSVAKGNHVTREYEVAVSADTTQDVKICPIGDADNNGRVNSADAKVAFQHGNEQTLITDPYKLACADVARPFNRVNSGDAKAIFQHANEQKSLWTVTAE